MNKYRIDALGKTGMFKEFNEIELIDSAQSFEVNLNTKNIKKDAELSLLIAEAKSRLGDFIGKYDFSITRLGIIDILVKDWSFEESENIFHDCMIEEFDYSEDY
jgi:hypothetical protein